ncbi:MAG: carbohydrate ABC transporter permease [Eubacteriales bacterium]|nr:carbohydrate ABC transporter permease [Eubacteriales bacterium]
MTRPKQSFPDRVFDTVNFIFVTMVMLVIIYPMYYICIASISDPMSIMGGKVMFWPSGINFDGYQKILNYESIWTGYRNTIFYTVFATTINVVVTLMAGYALSRRDLPGRTFFISLFMFTMFFSGGLIPTFLFVKSLKMYDTIWPMILLGTVSVWNLIITKTYFQENIPQELLEAAVIDGCDDYTFFRKVVLPLSRAIVAVLVIYYAVGHWNSYFNALIYLKTESKYPLQLFLRQVLMQNQFYDEMSIDNENAVNAMMIAESMKYGMIIISSLPILVIYPFLQKYFVQGVMIGAVKG